MLIEVSVFILLLVQLLNINWKYEGNKNKLILVASAFIAVLIYGAIKYWNILIFRFVNNPSGSGRIYFYDWIYNGWLTGDWINHLFGFGLYQVIEYLGSVYSFPIYAHSDWLELLYDHGILGITVYSIICITLL